MRSYSIYIQNDCLLWLVLVFFRRTVHIPPVRRVSLSRSLKPPQCSWLLRNDNDEDLTKQCVCVTAYLPPLPLPLVHSLFSVLLSLVVIFRASFLPVLLTRREKYVYCGMCKLLSRRNNIKQQVSALKQKEELEVVKETKSEWADEEKEKELKKKKCSWIHTFIRMATSEKKFVYLRP